VRHRALLTAALLALGAVALVPRGAIRPAAVLWAAALATLVAAWLGLAGRSSYRRVVVSAAVVMAIDLGAQWMTYVETASPARIRAASALLDQVDDLPSSQRILSVFDRDARGGTSRSTYVVWVVPRGLRSVSGYDPLLSRRFLDAFAAADPPRPNFDVSWSPTGRPSHPWYRSLGVRYVISEAGRPEPDDAAPIARTGEHTVWELRSPRPRAFVTDAALEQITHTPLHELNRVPDAEVQFERDDPDEVVQTVRARVPATLVLADAWAPGRSVQVAGQAFHPASLAAQAFRGVAVPAGRHSVRWRFSTPGRRLGEALSVAGIVLGVGVILRGALGRRRQPTDPAPR
jgi:hypothetical protein